MRWAKQIAVGLAVLVVVVYGWKWVGSRLWGDSPESLLAEALGASDTLARQEAAGRLANHPDTSPALLVRLFQESQDENVRVVALRALGDSGAFDQVDTLISGLEDDSSVVRSAAVEGLSRLLRRKIRFPVDGTANERAVALTQVKAAWEKLRDSPALECLKQGKPLAFFYDLNTKELFEGPADSPGPIDTPSGPCQGMPAGVRAHLFVCGSPEDSQPFIGFLSIPESALGGGSSDAGAGQTPEEEGEMAMLIKRPGDSRWVHQDSPEGERIIQSVIQQCPRDTYPRPYRPGD